MKIIFQLCVCVLLLAVTNCQEYNITFEPPDLLKGLAGTSKLVRWNVTSWPEIKKVTFSSQNDDISEVVEETLTLFEEGLDEDGEIVVSANFTIELKFIGFNDITIHFLDENDTEIETAVYETSCTLSYQLESDIFIYSMGVFLALIYVNMGATIKLKVIKEVIRRPVGPLVGIFCQYVVMPVLAFLLGLALFPSDVVLRLGLFLNGCCPGGGGSNMYTLLLGGSLDLSIMMTFASSVLAFATVPLWVLTMGPVILGESNFVIPYDQIAIIVISLIIPCAFGIFAQLKLPRFTRFLEKTLTPFALFNIIYTFTFGIYANRYIFYYITWEVVVAGMGLPWVGYTLGMVMALLFKMPVAKVITIGIETGLQNAMIALFILKTTLNSPEGELAFVVPAMSTLMTPIPLLIAIVVKFVYEKFFKKKSKETEKDNQPEKNGVEVATIDPPSKCEKQGKVNLAADLDDVLS